MSIAKEINFKAGNKFKDFAMKLCNLILLRATSKTKKIDFVFNSYFDYSIRSSIFKRKFHSGTVVYNAIGSTTNVPKPKYASEPDLNRLEIEEAEIKLMIHLNHVVKNKFTNAHVISSNTDVIVLAMHFFNYFQNDGLQTLWIQVGIDYTLRNVPIHSLVVYHGNDLCQVLPAAHHLTGSDDTSKVGTKFKALQANPTKYLSDFGKDYYFDKKSVLIHWTFGYIRENDGLIPEMPPQLFPPLDELVPSCTCKVCNKITCICNKMKIPCCSFCSCMKHKTCKNKFNDDISSPKNFDDENIEQFLFDE
ncbi:hypothetical protein TKK_0016058 [Trichogramma kaykai]